MWGGGGQGSYKGTKQKHGTTLTWAQCLHVIWGPVQNRAELKPALHLAYVHLDIAYVSLVLVLEIFETSNSVLYSVLSTLEQYPNQVTFSLMFFAFVIAFVSK